MRLFFRFRVTGGVIAALHAALAPPLGELAPQATERAFSFYVLTTLLVVVAGCLRRGYFLY